MSESAPIGARSQTDVVVLGIKAMILDGTLAPGARLPVEKVLADDLGVSRSSLREGVRALTLMGILDTRQGAGTFVTSLDPSLLMAPLGFIVDLQRSESALHLHRVRRVLETEAAELAATTMTEAEQGDAVAALERMEAALSADPADHAAFLASDVDFHRIVAQSSQNPILSELIVALTSQTEHSRLRRAVTVEESGRTTLAEHRAILAALVDRSPARAGIRMANHLLEVEDFLSESRPD